MSKHYIDEVPRRDGRIKLYKNGQQKNQKNWWMRIAKPDGRYITKTTKTPDFVEAANIAERILDEMVQRHKDGFSRHQQPEDYVLTTWRGGKVRDYIKQFNRMTAELEIERDASGDKRTPYSMRHTYITHRILYGNCSKDDVARNCGTSVYEIDTHYDHVLNEQKALQLTELDKGIIAQEKTYGDDLNRILRNR